MQVRTQPISYIDLHHSAANEANTEEIRRYHMDVLGWGDIGYNSVIETDGTIGEGRNVKWAGAHDPGIPPGESHTMNQIAFAIAHIGNFEVEQMSEVQFQASLNECERVCRQYNISVKHIRMHGMQWPTACAGKNFPYDRYIQEMQKRLAPENQIPSPTPVPPIDLNFSYPNNAQVVGDDFYIRDFNGNRIPGRYVADGDNITVLDVSYSRQLNLVEYPTASGVRSGYVKNVPSLIHYYNQGTWHNGSTPEPVLDESDNVIGLLNPYESATPLYFKGEKWHVVYNTDKGVNTKSGYVAYSGGLKQ